LEPIKSSENYIFLRSNGLEIGFITGPHVLFPKGKYGLTYNLADVKCKTGGEKFVVKATSSGQAETFVEKELFCSELLEYNNPSISFVLNQPERLEFILESEKGVIYIVKTIVLQGE